MPTAPCCPRQNRPAWVAAVMLVGALVLGGCAGGPAGRADGPPLHPPRDPGTVPDAEPRLEPIRHGGPNKPYEVLGRSYVPMTQDTPFSERGLASWYGRKFHGLPTSSGEPYDMFAMTAAHPTLPIPSYARIRNPANGREVVVRVNDRGPFHPGRIVDLSYAAASQLDLLRGVAPVELERITFDDIRTGAWRHGTAAPSFASAAASVTTPVPTPAPAPSPASAPASPAAPAVPTEAMGSVVALDGTVPVEMSEAARISPAATDGIATAPPRMSDPILRRDDTASPGYWVQLGAFRARDGAESFLQQVSADLAWIAPLLGIFSDASVYRLQAGPYPNRGEARAAAERVRTGLKLMPVIVERR
ncbi:MAG: septal ring lytic transglycosylase RlpA family protein [Pseudomonadota bacterium]|nr:septal ring lytic transglycosylase RlpA family protein [Pseudomonadota bacterium]